MIVLLGGGKLAGAEIEFLPGPLIPDANFVKAYAAMAQRANLTVVQAVEMRYDVIKKAERTPELSLFGQGPPSELERGSIKRLQWFRKWLREQPNLSRDQPSCLFPSCPLPKPDEANAWRKQVWEKLLGEWNAEQ